MEGLRAIRRRIYEADPLRPGLPEQEQVKNTWAIFADHDELLSHHDDFCRIFDPAHALRMEGEHRLSEENLRQDVLPLIEKILGEV